MAANVKGGKGRTISKLTLKEVLALNTIVITRYAESKMDNVEFALSINTDPEESKKFRFPLNAGHIATALKGADIPSNRPHKANNGDSGPDLGVLVRLQALEEQVAKLTKFILK